jgi:hypothetical protein
LLLSSAFVCLCQVVMHNPGHLFRTDPNGFVVPFKPTEAELEAAAVAKTEKAAEAAALDANHGSLFDHLLKNVLNEQPAAAPAAAPAAQEQQQKAGSESIVEQMNRLHQEQEQRKQQQEAQEAAAWGRQAVSSNGNGKQRQQQQAVCDMTPKTEEGRQAKAAFMQQYGKEYGYGGLLDQLYPCEVCGWCYAGYAARSCLCGGCACMAFCVMTVL